MKITEYKDYRTYINRLDLANMFNVYPKSENNVTYLTYNLNRGLTINGVNNIPAIYLDYHTVKEGETLNIISYKWYGSISLWWVIAKINNIMDATQTLEAGRSLYIIKSDAVNTILNTLSKS